MHHIIHSGKSRSFLLIMHAFIFLMHAGIIQMVPRHAKCPPMQPFFHFGIGLSLLSTQVVQVTWTYGRGM